MCQSRYRGKGVPACRAWGGARAPTWTGAAVTMQASITQYLGAPKRTPCPQQQSCAPASTRGAKTEKWEQNVHIHIFGLIVSALSCILEREGLLANSTYSYFITVPRQQYICMLHHIATETISWVNWAFAKVEPGSLKDCSVSYIYDTYFLHYHFTLILPD